MEEKLALICTSNVTNLNKLSTHLIANGYRILTTDHSAYLKRHHVPHIVVTESDCFNIQNGTATLQFKEEPIKLIVVNVPDTNIVFTDPTSVITRVDPVKAFLLLVAAINHENVLIITKPDQYDEIGHKLANLTTKDQQKHAQQALANLTHQHDIISMRMYSELFIEI